MRPRQSSTRAKAGSRESATQDPPARKRFGQNFLVDTAAIRKIVTLLDPAEGETILEIGPGRGALTEALLAAVPTIRAIEIDRGLALRLRELHGGERLLLIEDDVLDVPFSSLAAGGALVIVGNLPYNISKPVAMKLIVERRFVARAVLMFQREVADRLVARPGTRAYGPLTVLAGLAYRIERRFDLGPGAFRPSPKVVSTVTGWTRREDEALSDDLAERLRTVLSAAFAHRRQTLQKNLRERLDGKDAAAREVLAIAGIDGRLRAEAISPDAFIALARAWPV